MELLRARVDMFLLKHFGFIRKHDPKSGKLKWTRISMKEVWGNGKSKR